jgi:hypothetical protein
MNLNLKRDTCIVFFFLDGPNRQYLFEVWAIIVVIKAIQGNFFNFAAGPAWWVNAKLFPKLNKVTVAHADIYLIFCDLPTRALQVDLNLRLLPRLNFLQIYFGMILSVYLWKC